MFLEFDRALNKQHSKGVSGFPKTPFYFQNEKVVPALLQFKFEKQVILNLLIYENNNHAHRIDQRILFVKTLYNREFAIW